MVSEVFPQDPVRAARLGCLRSLVAGGQELFSPLAGKDVASAMAFLACTTPGLLGAEGSCLIPRVSSDEIGFAACGGKVQRSHVIQKGFLALVSDAGRTHGSAEVLQFGFDKYLYLVNFTKEGGGRVGSKPLWEVGPIPPERVSVTRASAEGFSCNNCDTRTFRPMESGERFLRGRLPVARHVKDFGFDETKSDLFSYQLFLQSYRVLLGSVNRGLGLEEFFMNAKQAGFGDVGQSRRDVDAFLHFNTLAAVVSLLEVKDLMDRRFLGLDVVPMRHNILLVYSAVPVASAGFHPFWVGDKYSYIIRSVLPDPVDPSFSWYILSCLEQDFFYLKIPMFYSSAFALQSVGGGKPSVDLFVDLASSDFYSWFSPEAYASFKKAWPLAAGFLEESHWGRYIDRYHSIHCGGRFCGDAGPSFLFGSFLRG